MSFNEFGSRWSLPRKLVKRNLMKFRMNLPNRKVRQLLFAGLILSLVSTIALILSVSMGILEHPYQHRLAVIIPLRDRMEELLEFIPHMGRFLKAQGVYYKFFAINQGDSFRFNRGALINIGYQVSKVQCDYMVMHDVDLLPLNPRLDYKYPDKENTVRHLAAPHLHPKYHYKTFVGGILLMRHEVFAKVDGLSTKYWGWGLEDDEFYVRMKEAEVTIQRPGDIGTGINNTFRHIHDNRRRPRDMVRIGDQKEESRKRDRLTGVHNIDYRILSKHVLVVDGYTVDVFNVHVECDRLSTPWCEKHKAKKNMS